MVQLWPSYCGMKVTRVEESPEEGGWGTGLVIDMKADVPEDNREKRKL